MAVVALAVAAALLGVSTPVAMSTDGRLGLSLDGKTWTSDLHDGLFEDTVRWVPGDQRTATFYVRNQSDEEARLEVWIDDTRRDELIESGDLTITAKGSTGAWTPADGPGSVELLRVEPLPAGAMEQVEVAVTLAADATNQSQDTGLDLAFTVQLSERVESSGQQPPDGLPGTGGVRLIVTLGGLGLIAAGWIITRRRKATPHE